MREIKFRAWHKDNKHMHVVHGLSWSFDAIMKVMIDLDSRTVYVVTSDEVELMQFTGLVDRNGKEVYEGDILSCPHGITLTDTRVWPHKTRHIDASERKLEIYWENGSFKIRDHGTGDWLLLGVSNLKEMEIIGNIYENEELVSQS